MTNKALWAAVGFVAVTTLALPARAEMYEWIDAKGVTHLTTYLPAAAPSPAPVMQQQTVSVVRTPDYGQLPGGLTARVERSAPAPLPSTVPAAPLRNVVEVTRQVAPPLPVAIPVKAPAPVAIPVKAPVPVAAAPTSVTAQISRTTRVIQVINGSRVSEQQQVTTTSVAVPH